MRIILRVGGGLILLVAAIVLFAVWMNYHSAQDYLRSGVAAKATVLNLMVTEIDTQGEIVGDRTIHSVRAKWTTPSGKVVEALSNQTVRPEDQAQLRVGGPVDVLYRADNPQSFMPRVTAERVAKDVLPFRQVGGAVFVGVLMVLASFVVGRRRATGLVAGTQ